MPPASKSGADPEYEELLGQLLSTDNVDDQVEILAVMNKRGFRPPTRGQGGDRRRQGPTRYLPPRGTQDLTNAGSASRVSCIHSSGFLSSYL